MNKTIINFKVDSEVKKQAQELAQDIGVPLSTVINAQLKQFLRTRSFSVSASPRMSAELEALLEQIETDRKAKRNFSPSFTSMEAMLAHLKKT